MQRRLISILIVIVILAGVFAGCKKRENKKKRRVSRKTKITTVATSETESSDVADTDITTVLDPDFDPDRVLFTYEYHNSAWGWHSEITIIMGDGRIYNWSSQDAGSTGSAAGNDYTAILNGDFSELTKTDAEVHLDMSYLTDMYLAASQVDANAPQTTEHVMCDYGQKSLYYWDEDGNKILCMSEGDLKYTIDDPHIADVEYFWNHMFKYIY